MSPVPNLGFPVYLTYEQVKAAAIKAYSEGILQAQAEPSGDRCSYHGRKGYHPCAIGAVFTPEQAAAIDSYYDAFIEDAERAGTGVVSLEADGFIKTATASDLSEMDNLQANHDNWNYQSAIGPMSQIAQAKAEFLESLGLTD